MSVRPVILIVDDDSSMRELLEMIIDLDRGFRIGGVAEDGFEGAMLAADLQPDIVILDFFMPRCDELCRSFAAGRQKIDKEGLVILPAFDESSG